MATVRVKNLMKEFRCSENVVRSAARECGIRVTKTNDKIDAGKVRQIRALLEQRTRDGTLDAGRADPGDPTPTTPEDGRGESTLPEPALVRLREQVGEVAGEGARKLYLHNDFFEWLLEDRTPRDKINRANLVLRHLAAFGKTGIVKLVRGPARGWRRSPLGGGHGMHFYLWWASQGTPPVADLDLDKNDILIRAVRHHDETSQALAPGDWPADYQALDLTTLVNQHDDYGFAYHDTQHEIARSTAAVRFIKGHPGSGKTNSLWLSASLLEGKKALYLTYNESLANEAEQYFSALGPASLAMQVYNFDDFLASIVGPDEHPDAPVHRSEQARFSAFEELVNDDFRGRLGPWDGKLRELHSELHAHLIGRALPSMADKRRTRPSLLMTAKSYRKAREKEIGRAPASTVLAVGRVIESAGRLGELFPGPVRAQRGLELLSSPEGARVRERFAEVDGMFVDEVQDLTLVEAFFLMRLCAFIGAHRERGIPAFVAAGDEGQTVHATDFEWSELSRLAAENIGRRSEWELSSNVRSPRKIALIINESWELYKTLGRRDRPRGYAHADVDEATQGTVIYTQCRDIEEFVEFVKEFDALPNAALVYPDHSIPADFQNLPLLADAIMTSRDAKGLGFQTVGVLAPGSQMVRIDELTDRENPQRHLYELWGRALVDHLRVALSRATENLLLIDIDPSEPARYQVHELCSEVQFMDMEPHQVIDFLRRDDRDVTELVAEFAEEVDTLLFSQPMRAYRRALQMTALLGERDASTAVHDEALRTQAWQLLGRAAIDVLYHLEGQESRHDRHAIFTAGENAFHILEQPENFDALCFLNRCRASQAPDWQLFAPTARVAINALSSMDPAIARITRQAVRDYCQACARQPVSENPTVRVALRQAFDQAVAALSEEYPELSAEHSRMMIAISQAAMASGHHAEALELLRAADPRDHASEAMCHRALGDLAAAAESFEKVGDFANALACLRDIPDVDGALHIARRIDDHSLAKLLDWLQRYHELMDELSPASAKRLTPAERTSMAEKLSGLKIDKRGRKTGKS